MARENSGISQAHLAKLSDLTPAAICQYEKGEREPGLNAVLRLRTSLGGIDLNEFLTGDSAFKCPECLRVKNEINRFITKL